MFSAKKPLQESAKQLINAAENDERNADYHASEAIDLRALAANRRMLAAEYLRLADEQPDDAAAGEPA